MKCPDCAKREKEQEEKKERARKIKEKEENRQRQEENRRAAKTDVALKRAEKMMSFLATLFLLTVAALFVWWWYGGADSISAQAILDAFTPAEGNPDGMASVFSGVFALDVLLTLLLLPVALVNFVRGRTSTRGWASSSRRRWRFQWIGAILGFSGLHLAYARRWGLFVTLIVAVFMWGGGDGRKAVDVEATAAYEEAKETDAVQKPASENVPPSGADAYAYAHPGTEGGTPQSDEAVQSDAPSEEGGIFTITNIGLFLWFALWFGGTLFIRNDGSERNMG